LIVDINPPVGGVSGKVNGDNPVHPISKTPDPNPGLLPLDPLSSRLSPIPKAWVLSSQVIFLMLRQAFKTVIPLAGGPGFVLVHAVEDTEDGEEDGPDLAA
jgi:hypothetical protein